MFVTTDSVEYIRYFIMKYSKTADGNQIKH